MYIPKSFEYKKIDTLHDFIEKFNFATLISHVNGEMIVTHVPVLLDRKQGQFGTLNWHVAKLNPHTTGFDGMNNALVIFHGPHAYISPKWYENAPNVPTWNYAVVHVHGIPEMINNDELSNDLTKMVSQHEDRIVEDQSYTIPDSYKLKLIQHIVGFRMEITKLEGKFKLGQNRSVKDKEGMLAGLRKNNSPDSLALVDFIESFL